MKIFHALFILFQLLLAFLSRDQNRVAYLKYLWSSYLERETPPGSWKESSLRDSKYKETKSEANTYEYSIFLER